MAALAERDEICQQFSIDSLTNHQTLAISGIKERKDVFVGTKTGSGKLLIYECVPILHGKDSITVVVAPLLSIMKEQTERLNSLGFKATYIGRDHTDDPGIKSGKFNFVFGSPEMLLSESEWRNMFLSDVYKKQLRLIVVDEAHTVVQW